jgi:hypothetical protein
VRSYLRYNLSYRDLEELLAERGIAVDHTSIYRWVASVHPAVHRRRKALPACARGLLAGRRDLSEGRRPVALPVPGPRPIRPVTTPHGTISSLKQQPEYTRDDALLLPWARKHGYLCEPKPQPDEVDWKRLKDALTIEADGTLTPDRGHADRQGDRIRSGRRRDHREA